MLPGETKLTQQQLAAQFIENNSAAAGVTEAAVLNDIHKLNRSYQWFSASLCANNQFPRAHRPPGLGQTVWVCVREYDTKEELKQQARRGGG